MAFILRKLDRKASFYLPDWLDEDDAQADALSSLRTKDNRLSVWRIDDDRGNLRRVVAALAAGRDFLDKLDYAVIDRQVPERDGTASERSSRIRRTRLPRASRSPHPAPRRPDPPAARRTG